MKTTYQRSKLRSTNFVIMLIIAVIIFVISGCSHINVFLGKETVHKGQFLDGPVSGLLYVSDQGQGITDKNGYFSFKQGQKITFKIGNIQIGDSVCVENLLKEGEYPFVTIKTPRDLVKSARSNRDTTVTNILRFLQTLDDDYNANDGADNAANGIRISENIQQKAATLPLKIDFTLSQDKFETEAVPIIKALTGDDRALIPALAAQNHFLATLLQKVVDRAINKYETPGVTMSIETPCPCNVDDPKCNGKDGEINDIVTYDKSSNAFIWNFAAGYADLENKLPMKIDTRFRIFSITKSFTAMTILKLHQEGLLNYNDLLDKYLSGYLLDKYLNNFNIPCSYNPYATTSAYSLTIAKLMNHTAGVFNFYDKKSKWFDDLLFKPEKQWKMEQLADIGLTVGPRFCPSYGWDYSNTGYVLLGMVINAATGKPWEEVIREKIINPYHLNDTIIPETGEANIFGPYSHDNNPTRDYAVGYMDLYAVTDGRYGKEGEKMVRRDKTDPSFIFTAGNMISSVQDLRKWAKLIGNTGTDQGLFNSNFDFLHDKIMWPDLFFKLDVNLYVGANIYYMTSKKRYIISGNSTGYDVNVTYDIKNKISAAACANRTFLDDLQIKDVLVYKSIDILSK